MLHAELNKLDLRRGLVKSGALSLEPGAYLQIRWEADHAPVQRHVVLVKFLVRADVPVEHDDRARPTHERRRPHLMHRTRIRLSIL